jgi:hypothetical protein
MFVAVETLRHNQSHSLNLAHRSQRVIFISHKADEDRFKRVDLVGPSNQRFLAAHLHDLMHQLVPLDHPSCNLRDMCKGKSFRVDGASVPLGYKGCVKAYGSSCSAEGILQFAKMSYLGDRLKYFGVVHFNIRLWELAFSVLGNIFYSIIAYYSACFWRSSPMAKDWRYSRSQLAKSIS